MGTIQDAQTAIYIISTVILVTINILVYARQRKKDREKLDDRFATKADVKKDITIMDKRMTDIEYTVETNRKENNIAHQDIKNEMINHFDRRFEDLKDFIKSVTKHN